MNIVPIKKYHSGYLYSSIHHSQNNLGKYVDTSLLVVIFPFHLFQRAVVLAQSVYNFLLCG